jgi:DNA-binding NarL/FixJ family response regulator
MIRVHIADDHPVVRQGLARMLAAEPDIAVTGESPDGESALRAVEAGGFDVLMLDLSLPGIGGLDVLSRARSIRPTLKVLVLTMHSERHYAVRVLRSGADGYLAKDCAPSAVLDAIRAIAAGGKYVPPDVAASLIEPRSHEQPHESLTERELAVLVAVGQGKTPSEIAGLLDLSNSTVSTHIARIRSKLEARSLGDLVRYAIKARLVE